MIKWDKIFNTLIPMIKKYKYFVLILLIGIGLLLLPGSREESKAEPMDSIRTDTSLEEYEIEMEKRLVDILSQIHGVGEVKVILTVRESERLHYQYDRTTQSDVSDSGTSAEESEKTVIISQGNSYDEPIVTSRDYPVFQGALIVCDGGGDAEIKLQLTQAVSALTNLSSHNITILKMK